MGAAYVLAISPLRSKKSPGGLSLGSGNRGLWTVAAQRWAVINRRRCLGKR